MPGALAAVGLAPVRPAWLVLWAARHARLAGFTISATRQALCCLGSRRL